MAQELTLEQKRTLRIPHEGVRQGERNKRQGLHMATINGFERIERYSSKFLKQQRAAGIDI